ncbi:hypothetical protein, partial [Kocuria sp. SM24M-10]|uniref:hypothetical protein n=1 Tax=Kocuria sp. SM24M-10 TaxID=1660349 RepID=UPI00064A5B18
MDGARADRAAAQRVAVPCGEDARRGLRLRRRAAACVARSGADSVEYAGAAERVGAAERAGAAEREAEP